MTRAEHILATLAEEGGEVAKECHKALRFGIDDKVTLDPYGPRGTEGPTNAEKIQAEMIDMLALYQMAFEAGLVPDLGLAGLPTAVWKKMVAKGERVERYMDYARRVGALSHVPKLNELACFSGSKEQPFRAIIEGPHGFHMIASNTSPEALLLSFRESAFSTFPPHYTEATLPDEPTGVQLIHPDYFEQAPPMVTAFKGIRNELGMVRIQWDDGTEDWANIEDLRPFFWSSLDTPPPPFEFQPMPTEGLDQVRVADFHKERLMASLGVKIGSQVITGTATPYFTSPKLKEMLTAAWPEQEGAIDQATIDQATIVPPRGFPEGSRTQAGLDSRGWPILTTVQGKPAEWNRLDEGAADGPLIWLQLRLRNGGRDLLGQVQDPRGGPVFWGTTGEGATCGAVHNLDQGMRMVEWSLVPGWRPDKVPPSVYSIPGTHRREAAESKGVAGHPLDDKRTRALANPALWRFGFDNTGRPVWSLYPVEDHGDGKWEPLTDQPLGIITKNPPFASLPDYPAGWWTAEVKGHENVDFKDDGATSEAEDKARAHVIAVLKEIEALTDVVREKHVEEAGEPVPKGPITVEDGDDVLVEPVNGLRCLWRRRFDELNCEVWDLLVRSDVEGQEWTDQDPVLGHVTESFISSSWSVKLLVVDAWSPSSFTTRDAAMAAAVDHLNNSPL